MPNQRQEIFTHLKIFLIRHGFKINLVLAILVSIVVLLNIIKYYSPVGSLVGYSGTISANVTYLSEITNIIVNVISALGIIVAGLWAYYVFVKGRTFTPKLDIDISKLFIGGEDEDMVFLRCKVRNSGKIKVTPNYVIAEISYGKVSDSGVEYELLEKKDNILADYTLKKDEKIYLEPTDTFDIDFAVSLRKIITQLESNIILRIKIAFVDDKIKVWLKNSTLIFRHYDK